METDINDGKEKSAEFYQNKDLFGLSKTKVENENIQKEVVEIAASDKPFSEFQSVKHFSILCLFSFGIYPVFWFYRHWRFLKDEKNLDIEPAWRTLFTLFYGYSLFSKFNKYASEYGYKKTFPLGGLFVLFIVTTLLVRIHDYLAVLSLFSFVFLIPVVNMMNFFYLKEQPNYPLKERLQTDEKIFLAIVWGILLFAIFNG